MVSTLLPTKPKSVQMDTPLPISGLSHKSTQNNVDSHKHKKSHSPCVSILKLVFCLFLLVVCGFQISNYAFVIVYGANGYSNSVVETSIVYPQQMKFPAVTVCNNNRFQKSKICLKEPQLCNKTGEPEDFYMFGYEKSISELLQYAQTGDELIENCAALRKTDFNSFDGSADCKGNVSRLYFEPYINCFTILSNWGENSGSYPQFQDNAFAGIILNLDFQKEEYTETYRYVGGVYFVHDANSPPNVNTMGHAIRPGYENIAIIEKTVHERLPAPYETKCRLYSERSNIGEPLSQRQCYSECMYITYVEKCGCMPIYEPQISPKRQGNCPMRNTTFAECYRNHLPFIGKQCELACPLSCYEEEFKVTSSESSRPVMTSIGNLTDEEKRFHDSKATLFISYANERYTRYITVPQFYFTWREMSMLTLWSVLSLILLSQVVMALSKICRCGKNKKVKANQGKTDGNDVNAVIGIDIDVNGLETKK